MLKAIIFLKIASAVSNVLKYDEWYVYCADQLL